MKKTLRELVKAININEVEQQSFHYTPKNWEKFPEIPRLLRDSGYKSDEIAAGFPLSRLQIKQAFATNMCQTAVILVPLWGYPRGVAGPGNRKPLQQVFANANNIAKHLQEFNKNKTSTEMVIDSMRYSNVGLSTLSKILYFAGIKCAEGDLLIYDQMVMRALHHHSFDEFGEWPGYSHYSQRKTYSRFVGSAHLAAKQLACDADCIEYALFREGQRLGSNRTTKTKATTTSPLKIDSDSETIEETFTWGGKSTFRYDWNDDGSLTLLYGSKPYKMTIHKEKIDQLVSHFSGCEVEINGPTPSLDAWVKENITATWITSYLAPALIASGLAERYGNKLRFFAHDAETAET